MDRYSNTPTVRFGRNYGTSVGANRIYWAVKNNQLSSTKSITKEGQRLDILAGKIYGNSGLWWVIAAASGIGWGLQVPAGTVIIMPNKLEDVRTLLG